MRSAPINAKQEKEIRASLEEMIQNYKEDEMTKPEHSSTISQSTYYQPIKRSANAVSWKKKLTIDKDVRNFDDSDANLIWNRGQASEFIP